MTSSLQFRRAVKRSGPTIIFVATLLSLLGLELWRSHWHAREDVERQLRTLTRVLSAQTAGTIQAIDFNLQNLANHLQEDTLLADNDAGFGAELQRRLVSMPYVRALFVIGPKGYIVHDTDYPATPRVSLADREYFRAHREDASLGLHIGQPLLSRSVGIWFVSLSRRIDNPDGSFGGIVVAAMEPLYFEQFYRQLWVGSGTIALFLKDGTLLARSPRNEDAIGQSFASSEPFHSRIALHENDVYLGKSPIDGIERLAGYQTSEDLPIVMMVTMNASEVMQPWRLHAFAMVIGAILVLAMTVILESVRIRSRKREDQAHNRLAQAERLETIGRFASGIAHDVGNLLQVVRSAVVLLRLQIADRSDAIALLDEVDDTLVTGRALVTQLLSYSRSSDFQLRTAKVSALVSEALPILRQAAGPKTEVVYRGDRREPVISTDPVQFKAALLNLVLNARDAMPQGGEILIQTHTTKRSETAKNWVEVQVTDHGTGMSERVRAKALDPFFTTKPPSSGSGIGLNQVHYMMERCGGNLEIISVEREGTRIIMRFPSADIHP